MPRRRNSTRNPLKRNRKKSLSSPKLLLGFLLTAAFAAFGIWFAFNQLGQSTELRNQAASDNGLVKLSSAPPQTTSFLAYSDQTVTLTADTNNLQVAGFQLSFTIQGSNFTSPSISVPSQSGLTILAQNTSQTGPNLDYFEVDVIVTPVNIAAGRTFASNGGSSRGILELNFPSVGDQNLLFTFNNTKSITTTLSGSSPRDELQTIQPFSYTVLEGRGQVVSPVPSPTSSAVPSPIPSPLATPEQIILPINPTPAPTQIRPLDRTQPAPIQPIVIP